MEQLIRKIIKHPESYLVSFAITLLFLTIVLYALGPHRGCWKELKARGYADGGRVLAFKLLKSVLFLKFDRSKSRKDIESDLSWLSEVYNEHFISATELRWLRFFGLKSIMKLNALSFNEFEKFKVSSKKEIVNFGINSEREIASIKLKELGLILATGRSGSGKTFFAKKLVQHFSKWKMKYILATPKVFDFPDHSVIDTEKSLDELESQLKEILLITEKRKEQLLLEKKSHASDLKENNDFVLIVIDEAYHILGTSKDPQRIKIQQIVNYLCRAGRAYGVITLLLSQQLVKGELGEINLRDGYVISGRQQTVEASVAAFTTDIAIQDFLRNGIMVFRNFEKTEIVKVCI
jgi:hypothetical protein